MNDTAPLRTKMTSLILWEICPKVIFSTQTYCQTTITKPQNPTLCPIPTYSNLHILTFTHFPSEHGECGVFKVPPFQTISIRDILLHNEQKQSQGYSGVYCIHIKSACDPNSEQMYQIKCRNV